MIDRKKFFYLMLECWPEDLDDTRLLVFDKFVSVVYHRLFCCSNDDVIVFNSLEKGSNL